MEICKICGYPSHNVNFVTKFGITSDNKTIKKELKHNYCQHCGWVYVSEDSLLNESDFYKNNYTFLLDNESVETIVFDKNNKKHSEISLDLIAPYLENSDEKNFLDIGAGKGNFLLTCYHSFPNIKYYAIEPSVSYHHLKKNSFIYKTYNGFFNSSVFKEKYFDYITLNHVLEHVTDPKDFLKQVKTKCKPDTILLVSVPNFDYALDNLICIDHISKFTPNSISNLFNILGFDILNTSLNSISMYFILKLGNKKNIIEFDIESSIKKSIEFLKQCESSIYNKKFDKYYIYGQGLIGEYFLANGALKLDKIVNVIDDNPLYHGKKWHGKEILSYEQFIEKNKFPVFINMNLCNYFKVIKKLTNYEIFPVFE